MLDLKFNNKSENQTKANSFIDFDTKHLWHPYSAPYQTNQSKNLLVQSAKGVYLDIDGYGEVIDAMSSWWCVIHGYNHPKLNRAIKKQLKGFSHIMFGGLTHSPAINLASKLLKINSNQKKKSYFQSVFLADSGSVSVEIALKMSLQYQQLNGFKNKTKIMSLLGGYHGDTLGAMSICDPIKGMHQLFNDLIPKQIFGERPELSSINQPLSSKSLKNLRDLFEKNHQQSAAFIIEPIVQGAGGMLFFSAEYLKEIRKLCDQFQVLLIFDEIATGFGRTGKLFAYQHADTIPDILCLGKAMSGGYLNIAAVLSKKFIADCFAKHNSALMHGPTFMANPLACAVSLASINLLLKSNWQRKIKSIEKTIKKYFSILNPKKYSAVKNVRFLGAIGVIEMKNANFSQDIQKKCLSKGIWIRPFGELIYIMPPYCIKKQQLNYLCYWLTEIIKNL